MCCCCCTLLTTVVAGTPDANTFIPPGIWPISGDPARLLCEPIGGLVAPECCCCCCIWPTIDAGSAPPPPPPPPPSRIMDDETEVDEVAGDMQNDESFGMVGMTARSWAIFALRSRISLSLLRDMSGNEQRKYLVEMLAQDFLISKQ